MSGVYPWRQPSVVKAIPPDEPLRPVWNFDGSTARLRPIQMSVEAGSWQTAGDLYRGKQLFLSQDLLNQIDTALEGI